MTEIGSVTLRVRPDVSHFEAEATSELEKVGERLGKAFAAAFARGFSLALVPTSEDGDDA